MLFASLLQDDKEDTSTHLRGWRLMTALIYLQLEHPKEKGLRLIRAEALALTPSSTQAMLS